MTGRTLFRAAVVSLLCVAVSATAEDWPTFRHDIQRTGITGEALAFPLVEAWVWQSPYAPIPAYEPGFPHVTNWEGGVEKRRIDFDRADSVIVAGGRVYFGSVGDGRVYCVDPATGKTVWTLATGGPVRLAPTVADGKLYVGSDDGWVYCADAATGKVIWTFQAAPDDLRVVGNGFLVSLWPVRTGVLVDKGVAYFGAGIFPAEGVFLYAVDAATGEQIWRNDREGETRLAQFMPQGYLLASDSRIVVPRGRLAPAVCDRATGDLLFMLSIYYGGGTFAAMRGDLVFTGWENAFCFPVSTTPGEGATTPNFAQFPGGQLVAAADFVYSCGLPKSAGTAREVIAYKWTAPPADNTTEEQRRRGEGEQMPQPEKAWAAPIENAESVILADKTLIVGAHGEVQALNTADGGVVWSSKVDGQALSLTVADGRLYVSTDTGKIYCYAAKGAKPLGAITAPSEAPRVPAGIDRAADEILKLAPDARKGFALVYGVETGDLAIALAQKTEMKVYAVSPDAEKVAAVRERIEKTGLYGGRIVVQQCALDRVPYTQYFADLVVSETMLQTGKPVGSADEVFRMTKPIRGTVVLGAATDGGADPAPAREELLAWAAGSALVEGAVVAEAAPWTVYVRRPLEGAKPWVAQYGLPGGTGSSEDELVRAPLRVQWWGQPGAADFVDRHYWGAAPLAMDGRVFICSYSGVAAHDAYTGIRLWFREMKDATRAHIADVPSNVAIGEDGYFVAVDDTCYRLDPATGELLGEFKVPGDTGMWGYVGYGDGVLIGSRTLGELPMENWRGSKGEQVAWWLCSNAMFAYDVKTGAKLWQYDMEWFRHNNVALGEGVVYFSHPDGAASAEEAVAETRPLVAQFDPPYRDGCLKSMEEPYVEMLAAVNVRSGQPVWKRPVDWTLCGGGRGTLIYKDGLLLQLSDIGGCKAFNGYQIAGLSGPVIAVRDAGSGQMKWFKPLDYRSRAVVVKDTIFAEPWAYDLQTGERKMVANPVTGEQTPWLFFRPEKHCGPFSASAHALFYRCGGFGYYDVARDEGTTYFDSNRPNCWTSFISAEGLAIWPTSDSGCRCGFPHQCSVALVHDDQPRVFGDYVTVGALMPVRHLGLNLGAPGDRRAGVGGRLWMAHPRRKFIGSLEVPITETFAAGGAYRRVDSSFNPVGWTDKPWLYASRADGLTRLDVPLRTDKDGPATYTVTLHFAAPEGDAKGARVFDIKVQGQLVRKGFDIVAAGGGASTAVAVTVEGVQVATDLTIELIGGATPAAWPILNAVEIVDKEASVASR